MPTSAHPSPDLSPLHVLDGCPVPGSRAEHLFRALRKLWDDCRPEDQRILSPLGCFLAEYAEEVKAAMADPAAARPNIPEGSYRQAPVATALLQFLLRDRAPGLTRLTAILATAALEAGTELKVRRKQVVALSSILRGAFEKPASSLHLLTRDVRSIPALVRSIEATLDPVEGRRSLHPSFEDEWKDWVRDTLLRWIQADPRSLVEAMRPKMVPDLEGPAVPVAGGAATDPDDGVESEIFSADPEPQGGDSIPLAISRVLADAKSRFRASQGDLMAPPDHFAPSDLIAQLAQAALEAAVGQVGNGALDKAEPPAALALSIATGLREIDLSKVVWGTAALEADLVLDRDVPVIHRKVFRPPNAVEPAPELQGWLSRWTDRIAWPLPPSLHWVLKRLARSSPLDGTAVLPRRSGAAESRYRLWTVAEEQAPGLAVGATQVRMALAAELSGRLGPEVAQLAMADTFSSSVAPGYYTAPLERDLALAVAAIQERWFGEPSHLPEDRGCTFGSRLVLTDEAAREWPAQLRKNMWKAVGEEQKWGAHALHLAASLCAVTGARLVDALGRLDLDQVIPEYGLVILRDKAVDTLRLLRIAATGRRWIVDLREFLDRLVRISEGVAGPEAAALAIRILRSEAPLFALPDGEGGEVLLTAERLRRSMPQPLQVVSNFYRHRLNQRLQRLGVDPELRHAQLGWVVSPAHTFANLSHWSAKSFGAEMAEALDRIMMEDGWFRGSQRITAWTWDGVPERPAQDWNSLVEAFAKEHRDNIQRLRKILRERWKEIAPRVAQRLAAAVAEFFPALRLEVEPIKLQPAPNFRTGKAVELSIDHHALLCERVRQGDSDPGDAMEAVVARILLYRVVRSAKRKGLVMGPTPSRPFFRTTSDPPPFIPGLGLAVRHAESARMALLERAAMQRPHDQGPLTAMSLMAFTPYRSSGIALAAVEAAPRVAWATNRPACVRVDAIVDRRVVPVVLGGLPALALGRRGIQAPKARAPTPMQLGDWIHERLASTYALKAGEDYSPAAMEALFRAAGRIELSGQERTVMLGDAVLATVPAERSLARDDEWELRTALSKGEEEDEAQGSTIEDEVEVAGEDPTKKLILGAKDEAHGYRRLTGLLSPEGLAKNVGGKSDGHRAWRMKLEKQLAASEGKAGSRTNLGLLHGFARHRLRYGGAKKVHLAHITLGSDLTRFAADLLAVAQASAIVQWSEEQFRDCYLATLLCKTEGARSQACDALAVFHEYLVQVHQAPQISFSELRKFAGARRVSTNPGLPTKSEVSRVFEELLQDLEAERAKPDASPEAMRCLELRALMFLVLDGSGIRPRSAHGLTLGDVLLLGPGRDFVRVRTSGDYGHAKTQTSTGFIPLEGSLWTARRQLAVDWLKQERERMEETQWWKIPLFSNEPGGRRRFAQAFLTSRIDALLKWASADRKASTYWLRKGRVSERHAQVAELPKAMARDVHGVLCRCGHVEIDTPMASYIGEPAIVMARHLRDGLGAKRAAILALSGIDGPQVDMAWMRSGNTHSERRLATVLEKLGLPSTRKPAGRLTDPPVLRRRQSLLPLHIDAYSRAMQASPERREALMLAGITHLQADRLDASAQELMITRGEAPWAPSGCRHESAAMTPPRALMGTEKLRELMGRPPEDGTILLAQSWARQGQLSRMYEQDVIMVLKTPAERAAALALLQATSASLIVAEEGAWHVLRIGRRTTRNKSHAALFHWVLAMAWLHHQVMAGAHS